MRKLYLIMLALVLTACSTAAPTAQPTATATTPASSPTSAATATAAIVIPDAEYPKEPRGVINAFFTTLQQSSNAQASTPYLTPALRERLGQGTTLLGLLGVQETYPSFQVLDVRPGMDVDTTNARVALAFEDRFEERAVTLVREGGRWLISEVLPAKGEYRTSEDYPRDPAGFIRAFLLALQTGNETLARSFLSFNMQAQAGSGPLLPLLSLDAMYDSFEVEQTPGDERGFVDVRVTFKTGGEAVERLFSLEENDARWHISSIMFG